jgi:sulfite reductase (ferredoxin)
MELLISEAVDKRAQKDILELHEMISSFQSGRLDAEKFRAFRLTRGVYGQRQDGVNMIRIKLPFGKVTPQQLIRIADVADKYGSGNLHTTTRQDIQLHYVKLTDAPQLWAELEDKGITLREACGNTIRNMTASYIAGIDPDELFDVSPYVNAMFNYFLRNPICQELGRKFKIAFSSSEKDSAFSFIHDLGFIPKIKIEDGLEKRGFKVVLGGGLGAQPFLAHPVFDFLDEDLIIPFTEGCLRIFDRFGERAKRHKARLKYLINDIGIEEFLMLVSLEQKALKNQSVQIDRDDFESTPIPPEPVILPEVISDPLKYEQWLRTNTFEQKQTGFYAVQIKLTTGDIKSETARRLASLANQYAAEDIRITVNQGMLIKYIRESALIPLFNGLNKIGLAEPGFGSTLDITACPGTDTCNLGIASSMGLTKELERMLAEDYDDLVYNNDIKIKISGCMNACGHHTIANIGFHGMSLKAGKMILPGMQVLLGGGTTGNGEGILADKVIKLPAKRTPHAVKLLLDDYAQQQQPGESFNNYYQRAGKNYFYNLLKPISELTEVTQDDLLDWGTDEQYKTMIGVGECAGALVDMVALILDVCRQTQLKAEQTLTEQLWVDAIYYSYNLFVTAAKALLLTQDLPNNTHYNVLSNFEKFLDAHQDFGFEGSFKDKVLEINQHTPSKEFAERYSSEAKSFYLKVVDYRDQQLYAN